MARVFLWLTGKEATRRISEKAIIKTLKDGDVQALFDGKRIRQWLNIEAAAKKKLHDVLMQIKPINQQNDVALPT